MRPVVGEHVPDTDPEVVRPGTAEGLREEQQQHRAGGKGPSVVDKARSLGS